MTKNIYNYLILPISLVCTLFIFSCQDDKEEETRIQSVRIPIKSKQTLLMYMPWSGNLKPYFDINIADMEEAISDGILENERVLVLLSNSETEASLFELFYDKTEGICNKNIIKEYINHNFTTPEGIADVLNNVKKHAPADVYSMTIGGHGMGWIPVNKPKEEPNTETEIQANKIPHTIPKYHWEVQGEYLTRYFGGTSSNHQTDIKTLAEGIEMAGIHMEYILFDDCYMSNIEVAYDLRHVTNHLIASTSEVMAYGMPYRNMAIHLLGNIDYEGISQAFYDFYMDYSTPCGTIAMTVTSELDSLATLMCEINNHFVWDSSKNNTLQYLDGYSPHLFYDYGDYVSKLCTDSILLTKFNEQLELTVPPVCSKHTPTFYSMFNGRQTIIHSFSGVTISDPSTNRMAESKTETDWYKATHPNPILEEY